MNKNIKEEIKKVKCIICGNDSSIIVSSHTYPPSENNFATQFRDNPRLIKNKDGSITCNVCENCSEKFKRQKAQWEIEKIRTKLRETKCSNCQQFLLKENRIYARYTILYKKEIEEEMSNKENMREEDFVDKFFCHECWEIKKSHVAFRIWVLNVVNPEECLRLNQKGERVGHIKID